MSSYVRKNVNQLGFCCHFGSAECWLVNLRRRATKQETDSCYARGKT